jgi:UDP-N-acetylenolpyruvoylglucosamine reductase
MATWHKQPLVLINEHASSSDDLQTFKDQIVQAVKDKFSVTLQQEPEFVE